MYILSGCLTLFWRLTARSGSTGKQQSFGFGSIQIPCKSYTYLNNCSFFCTKWWKRENIIIVLRPIDRLTSNDKLDPDPFLCPIWIRISVEKCQLIYQNGHILKKNVIWITFFISLLNVLCVARKIIGPPGLVNSAFRLQCGCIY